MLLDLFEQKENEKSLAYKRRSEDLINKDQTKIKSTETNKFHKPTQSEFRSERRSVDQTFQSLSSCGKIRTRYLTYSLSTVVVALKATRFNIVFPLVER
mgnify:CR=1 FL=1